MRRKYKTSFTSQADFAPKARPCNRLYAFAMPICIYCRTRADVSFPKEHVVSQAFGRFLDNLTLQCVCGACNSFFDRELEVFLTRDSVEALLRVRYGLKTKSGRRKLGTSRLTIRVISPGDWYGARIRTKRNAEGTEIATDRSLQKAHGVALCVGVVEPQRLQPGLPRVVHQGAEGERQGVPQL